MMSDWRTPRKASEVAGFRAVEGNTFICVNHLTPVEYETMLLSSDWVLVLFGDIGDTPVQCSVIGCGLVYDHWPLEV